MSNTRRAVRALAGERGYTLSKIADEAAARGYGTRSEAVAALRWPMGSCPVFVPALQRILGLTREEVDSLRDALRAEAEEMVRSWQRSVA